MAVAAGSDGAMWFTQETGRIGRIDPSGRIAQFTVCDGNCALGGIASDSENIWFSRAALDSIGRMNLRTHRVTTFKLSYGDAPSAITPAPDGSTWFTESDRIGRISPAGKIAAFALRGVYGIPSGIALGPDGNMWFADFNASRIGRIDSAGKVAWFSDGLSAGSSPASVAFGPDGNLWFTEYNGNRIGKLQTRAR